MNRREIFERTMNFKPEGKVLVDLGKQVGSIHSTAYQPLRSVMGLAPSTAPILDRMSQCVEAEEDLLEALGIDFRWILPNWIGYEQIDENNYRNMFGTVYNKTGLCYSAVSHPLEDAVSLSEGLKDFKWPDTNDPELTRGLREKAKKIYETTDYVIGLDGIKGGPLFCAYEIRGMTNFYMDFILDPKGVHELMDKLSNLFIDLTTKYLNEVGEYGQLIYLTDDFGAQNSLLMSKDHWREFVKPYEERLIKHIKKICPHLKVMFHTDGSVLPLIDEMIEMGVEILNPVQTSVEELRDTYALNEKYGDKIGFHGGMDVQNVLLNATEEEVKEEVIMRMNHLGNGGGYIISTCHNIGADLPPENLKVMYDTIQTYGKYPLTGE